MEFLKGAKDLARNPLGIIALFISLIYGIASLLLGFSADKLSAGEKFPLIIFIVSFPVLVLAAFYKLVTEHHGKLYAPGDFKDDRSFLRTLSPEEQEKKLEKEVKESFSEQKRSNANRAPEPASDKRDEALVSSPARETLKEAYRTFREDLKLVESSVIAMIASELNIEPDKNIAIGGTDAAFDAYLKMHDGKAVFLEVKALRSAGPAFHMIDRLLYNAVVADKFFHGDFKLIIAVVYYFDKSDLSGVERFWITKTKRCPVDISLRFIHRDELITPSKPGDKTGHP